MNSKSLHAISAKCLLIGSIVCGVSTAFADEPIRIGGIFDLSTAAGAVWGKTERDSFLLAIEDFKAAHPGVNVESPIEDSEYTNTKSITALQKLVSASHVPFVVGPTWEPFTAIVPICEKRKILCFAPSNHSAQFDDPARPLKFSFSAYFEETGYATAITDALKAEGKTKAAVFAAESDYYELLARTFEKYAPVPAITLQRFPPAERDFRAAITRLPADIDSLVLFLDGNGQGYSFLRQWSELRRDTPPIYSHDGIAYEPQIEEIKKMPFSIRFSNLYFPDDQKSAWTKKYRARFGHDPESPSGSIAYDETMLILNCAVSKADGSLRSSAEGVAECIRNTNNYVGVSGNLSFNGAQTIRSRKFVLEELK